MKRRSFLAASTAAALSLAANPTAAGARAARHRLPLGYVPFDAQPYVHPDALHAGQVDDLIWPAVKRINQSGWVWTLESCQGHTGRGAWSPVPLIRVAVHHGEAHRMLGLFARSAAIVGTRDSLGPLDEQVWVEVQRHVRPPMPGWFEARLRIHGPHGITGFERFAEALND